MRQSSPYVFDVIAQCYFLLSCKANLLGLAAAVIAYASQTITFTDRDSPTAVIFFAIASLLLFTLPRFGGSYIPHAVVLILGMTTLVLFVLGNAPKSDPADARYRVPRLRDGITAWETHQVRG